MRALSIIAVIGFHGFPTIFTGGLIGVDVFFVISGYLITGIFLQAMLEGRFPLAVST